MFLRFSHERRATFRLTKPGRVAVSWVSTMSSTDSDSKLERKEKNSPSLQAQLQGRRPKDLQPLCYTLPGPQPSLQGHCCSESRQEQGLCRRRGGRGAAGLAEGRIGLRASALGVCRHHGMTGASPSQCNPGWVVSLWYLRQCRGEGEVELL